MNGVRTVIAWPIVWALFWIADRSYWILARIDSGDVYPQQPDPIFKTLWRIYQRGMAWSYQLQAWAEGGVQYTRFFPWKHAHEDLQNFTE